MFNKILFILVSILGFYFIIETYIINPIKYDMDINKRMTELNKQEKKLIGKMFEEGKVYSLNEIRKEKLKLKKAKEYSYYLDNK